MSPQDYVQRAILPIPDRPRTGLVTYDAKDPDTVFPPITRRPKRATTSCKINQLHTYRDLLLTVNGSFF